MSDLTKLTINCIKVGKGDSEVYYDFSLPKDAQIDILTASIYQASINKLTSSSAVIGDLTAYDTTIHAYNDKESNRSFQVIGPNVFFNDAVEFEPSYEEIDTQSSESSGSYDTIDIFSGFDEEKGISSIPLHIYNNPTEDNKNFDIKLTSSNIECVYTKTGTAGKYITSSYNSSWEQILNPNFTEFNTDADNKIKITIGDHYYEKEITDVANAVNADYASEAGTADSANTASVAYTASYSSSTAQNVWLEDTLNNNYIKLKVSLPDKSAQVYKKYISIFPNRMPYILSANNKTIYDGSGKQVLYYYAILRFSSGDTDIDYPLGVIRFNSMGSAATGVTHISKSVSKMEISTSSNYIYTTWAVDFSYSLYTKIITLNSCYQTILYEETNASKPTMVFNNMFDYPNSWKILLCKIQDNYEESDD